MSRWIIADTVSPQTRIALLEQLAAQGARDPFVHAMGALVDRALPANQRAESLLALMQHGVAYRADPAGQEVFQSVRETLAEGGDCEDLAALFVSIATVLGLRARLVWLHQQIHGALLNHVYPQVWLEGVWVDADPSVAGARLSESPASAVARLRG